MDKIKILHVFDMFNQGGIENFIMNVYRNINREIFQFDFAFRYFKQGVFDDEAKELGAHIYYFLSEKKTLKNYKLSLTKINKDFGPYTVIHSHCYFFSGYILDIAKKNNIPIRIAHSHDTKKGRKETLLRKLYEFYMRNKIHNCATNMLSCSIAAGQYVFGKNATFQTLYNGIDLNRFAYNTKSRERIRNDLGATNKDIVLLNIGRFVDQKNHKYQVEIIKELSKHPISFKYIFIGNGPYLPQIKSLIKKFKLDSNIIFLENIYNTEDYYNAADIFLLPSKYEGMGIVAIEAQASGLPSLISSKVPKEINITDLVENIDISVSPSIWVESILKWIHKKINRSAYFQNLKNSPFDIYKTVKDLENIYSSKR